jgi:hypothetical protein
MVDRNDRPAILDVAREITAIHLRNLEALAEAQRFLIEGNKLVLQQQLECFQMTLDRMNKAVQDILSDLDPRSNVGRRFDLLKDCMKQSTCDTSILAELGSKFSGKASNIVQERVYRSLDEAKAVVGMLFDGVGTSTDTKAKAA